MTEHLFIAWQLDEKGARASVNVAHVVSVEYTREQFRVNLVNGQEYRFHPEDVFRDSLVTLVSLVGISRE